MHPLARWLLWTPLVCSACSAQNPLMMQQQLQTLHQQQVALAQQNQELVGRAQTLDTDNQQLESLLAQSRQQTRILQDEVVALRDQLRGVSTELARARDDHDALNERARALAATTRKRVGASISANSSLRSRLGDLSSLGVEVRQDGDVIRIELPGSRLFAPGSATLLPDAAPVIDAVADELSRGFARHRIGIEGHTDSDPIHNSQWGTNHHLSVGRAAAVYDYLITRSRLRPEQLFTVGHGSNQPVVSNATAAGKERNRRVELVIYPETLDRD